MMPRKPALSTQLKVANQRIAELEDKLQLSESNKNMYYRRSQDAEAMIEQVHQVLDAVPNSVSRTDDAAESYNRTQRTPVTRLAAWLAIR